MATTILTREVNLKVIECGTCGVPFALSETFWQSCYDDGGFFYCPMGHGRGWSEGNTRTATQKLKDRIAQLESSVAYKDNQIEAEKRKATAAKSQLTKERNRIKNGVCPCCNRSFQNLKRHIATKHPEFTPSED